MNTAESPMLADYDLKKMELGAQQQQQLPLETDAITKGNLVEAVAVQVLDGRPQQEAQHQGGVVIHNHYVVSSPPPSVGNNGDIQCCYPVR